MNVIKPVVFMHYFSRCNIDSQRLKRGLGYCRALFSMDAEAFDPVCLLASMAAFSFSWHPGVLEYYWVNAQWAESHRSKQKQTFRPVLPT